MNSDHPWFDVDATVRDLKWATAAIAMATLTAASVVCEELAIEHSGNTSSGIVFLITGACTAAGGIYSWGRIGERMR